MLSFRYKKITEVTALADGLRVVGEAKAKVVTAKGDAEAQGLQAKAAAFASFTNAAKLRLVLDSLPRLAAEVCAPLAKTSEIVILGESAGAGSTSTATVAGLGRDFMRMSATVPPGVRALTGVDLSKVGRPKDLCLCLNNLAGCLPPGNILQTQVPSAFTSGGVGPDYGQTRPRTCGR